MKKRKQKKGLLLNFNIGSVCKQTVCEEGTVTQVNGKWQYKGNS